MLYESAQKDFRCEAREADERRRIYDTTERGSGPRNEVDDVFLRGKN
jgi:hypothetical protein